VLPWLAVDAVRAAEVEAARVALVWKAPSDLACATSGQIRAQVERLSQTPLVAREAEFEIEAMAIWHEGSWVASVALRDAAGHILGGREVTGRYAACRDLDLPVALVVATLLDQLRTEPVPAAVAPPPAPPQPQEAKPRNGFGVGAFLAGAFGLLPQLTVGAGAIVELASAWPVAFTASAYWPGHELDANERGAKTISFHAGTSVCPRLFGQRHLLRLCADAQVGAALAKSVDLSASQSAGRPLVLLGLAPQLVLRLTASWALQTSLGAYFAPVRPEFHWQIEGSDTHSTAAQAFALIARISVIDFLR
jgi:hypothetical protein